MTIRTRFAPSPTGYLHIGGVRTALFNYLFAKKHGGQFILRIDDTDQQRNVSEALQPILDGLRWLGIEWDEGPNKTENPQPNGYYQSQRNDKYQAAVDELLKSGFAYRDFAKPEEIQTERDAAVAEKKTFTYSRTWAAETEADVKKFEADGRQGIIRLKMPREGKLVIHDLVRGDVEFDWSNEQDHVIQRTDGSFLYHLANVVDDEDFQISHVIRAEEHLPNTPRQIFMIQSLGYHLPEYAHLPFVAEPGSKTKLSKRKLDKYLKNKDFAKLVNHANAIAERIGLEINAADFNPVIVDFYRTVGYLPEAIVNAMALVGWALDDKTELFTMRELIDAFSLEGVTKGAASFDPAKLFAFEEKHFLTKTVGEKVKLCVPFLTEGLSHFLTKDGDRSSEWCQDTEIYFSQDEMLRKLIGYAGERIKVAGDILDFIDFFIPDEMLPYNETDYEKRIKSVPEALPLLKEFRQLTLLGFDAGDWTHQALEKLAMDFIAEKGIKPNALIFPLRVATTGKSIGIGMFEALELLGKERTLRRIERTLQR
ncbi:MAG: glutamate--tRNA ligase [Planctomycetaceae bacterium]|jgi:glutamyl-tRNA synthetase|nr:glutamate--tRNA ligase [Planctomycetaceae bacterium]